MMMKSSLMLQRTVSIRKKYTFCKVVSEVSSFWVTLYLFGPIKLLHWKTTFKQFCNGCCYSENRVASRPGRIQGGECPPAPLNLELFVPIFRIASQQHA